MGEHQHLAPASALSAEVIEIARELQAWLGKVTGSYTIHVSPEGSMKVEKRMIRKIKVSNSQQSVV